MISPSRKKRPTTPLNSQTMISRGSRFEVRCPNRRSRLSANPLAFFNLHFSFFNLQLLLGSLVALTVLATTYPLRAEVTRLKWGNERTPVKKQASARTALRFVKPGVASAKHTDAAIKLVIYDERTASQLTSARAEEPQTRSVVVNRESDLSEGFRAAQAPAADQGPTGSNANSKIEDSLRSPFSDNSAEPVQPNPITLPPPDENRANAQPDNNLLQLNQQPPSDVQTPPATEPDTGQFQPILPAGPGPDQSPPLPATNETTLKAEGEKAKESCDKSLENLRAYTVDKVNLNIAITGTEGTDFPFECSVNDGTMFAGRCWEQTTYLWKASAMCHKPLYFEDEQLERYGHSFSPCFQPFVSGAHFFTHVPVLPYCMGVEPPNECIYALGYYRPGSCAPYMCNPIPLSLRGALFEAGVFTGAAAILP